MRGSTLFALAAVVVLAGCDDDFGPRDWVDVPDTAVIYSLSRPELVGYPSAFDFVALQTVRAEAPGSVGIWDIALAEDGDGLVLVPASGFEGVSSRAGIAVVTGTSWEDLVAAPADTAEYRRTEAVPLLDDAIYVVRTRRAVCGLSAGVYYAKFQPVSIDPATGSMRFAYVRNPNCNDRSLIPPR